MSDATDADLVTLRVVYVGRVQGVGFRHTVRSIATHYPVKGYVKNMPDGTVEMVASGSKAAVEGLLNDVARRFHGNIRGSERTAVAKTGDFNDFEIRF